VKQQIIGTYDNQYYYNNVYGHALALLRRQQVDGIEGKIHLDIGCGYGRIAEPLTAELGATYVGIDADGGGLASLRSRGYEAHSLWLAEEEPTYEALMQIVGNRRVGSITMLDTLEHLADGDQVLRAISRLAIGHSALVVISVPNVAHNDIGFKLAFGRWDYTKSGLLDHTHLRLFSADVLDRVLHHAGFFTIDSNDVLMSQSDQHFPQSHSALARGSMLHAYLSDLRRSADPNGNINQFVRLCIPSTPTTEQPYLSRSDEAGRPFLSIVVRTQGKRMHTFEEVLTALAGQSDTDFEVLVMGHRLSIESQTAVERALEDCPEWLRKKCRLVLVDDGNRTRPLNAGFADAKGDYIVILDDDDLPFGNWVEAFHEVAERTPGRMLRTVTVRQEVTNVAIDGLPGLRAIGPFEKIFPSEFDYLAHLRSNHTPGLSMAFPRGVFHDLGLHFDESLTTTEDWDYIMRVAGIVGTSCSLAITSIYRWWHQDESSRSVHAQEEWDRNHNRIFQKMDDSLIIFPAGTAGRIRYLLNAHDGRFGDMGGSDLAAPDRIRLLQEVVAILTSTCWRVTWPLRLLGRLFGRPNSDYSEIWYYDVNQLREIAICLRRSNSWGITALFRRLRGG
jgi:2-polyprenyl-3-methyl-5-hydroxy-6-metoxy-1,4-benzoquinol methylase/glycosyltransferase involved in cell wall biosynthesis